MGAHVNRTFSVSHAFVAVVLSALPFGGCADGIDSGDSPGSTSGSHDVTDIGEAMGSAATPSHAEQSAADPSPPSAPSPSAAGNTVAAARRSPIANELAEAGFPIDPERSLLIRAPAIVDNSTRTLDPCDARRRGIAPGPSSRAWTFGHLMTQMANGRDPAVFAHTWLANWALPTRLNGQDLVTVHTVNERSSTLARRIYEAWQRESGGTVGGDVRLAMNRAPFRLLAIVNRFDLRHNRRFNEGNSGELRFVFSVLDLNRLESNQQTCFQASSSGAPTNPTVGDQLLILEYAVDHLSDSARRDWILRWTALTDLAIDDPAFATALEQLTQTVVTAGAGGSRPNGSALIRIRTNESADGVHWDLREFTINASTGYLVPTTVKQTPKAAFSPQMAEPGLVTWVSANASAVLNDTHRVPDQLLGVRSINQARNSSWAAILESAGVDPMVAFEFSRRTCVGCHSADTGSSFFHVHGRPFGARSEISHFLDGEWPNAPESCPRDLSGQPRCFSEFSDRADDILSYLNGGG